jgi:hypothetical protein
MKSGMRLAVGAVAGVAGAVAVCVLLLAGEYEAGAPQYWAAMQSPHPGSPLGAIEPVGSVKAAALIGLAAIVVGVLCGWRRLSPAAPLMASLPLAVLGIVSWLDTSRMTQLIGGSMGQPWYLLITDQVFLVIGGVLLIAAAAPSRWRPEAGPALRSRGWSAATIVLGLAVMPVAWYLVQLTSMTPLNTAVSYWWPFRLTSSPSVDALFVLVITTLGILAASRSLRITAIIAGTPMLALGLLGLVAPSQVSSLIGSVGFGADWQDALLLDVTSGLPLLYGGILVTAALAPAVSVRRAAVAGRRWRSARSAAVP